MSPDRDPGRMGDDHDIDDRDDESPRSIFSALWFRALLTVLVLGVLAAVAVPYVLDFATTPTSKATPTKSTAAAPAESVTATPATPPAAAPPERPAAPAPTTPASTAPAATAPAPTAAASDKPETPAAQSSKSAGAKPAATKPRTMVAKAVETEKPTAKAAKASESEKPGAKTPKVAEAEQPAAKAASGPGGGAYWVQVGAFKDAETAKRLAARLREQGLRVEESTTTTGSARASTTPAAAPRTADRYDVLVSGASAADVEAKLAPKGLKGETTANGVVVRPSLSLREAVALSRDLADAGLSVQVRRIGDPAPAPPASAPSPITLYRVRVGSFPDRAAAVDAMKRLEDKGLKPFLARGNQ